MDQKNIEAIFLDVGHTLRIVVKDPVLQAQAIHELMKLIGAIGSEESFIEQMECRWKSYRKWSFDNLTEASETELWTQWMLPDFPVGEIAPLHGKLTRLWRDRDGRRVPRPDVKKVVIELSQRGYILGIIANITTETEIPDWLEADGLTSYFKAVVLSSKVRYRKPGPEIYLEACRQVGVEPEHCVYVGDNIMRDVVGAQKAGYAMTIILMEPATLKKDPIIDPPEPDFIIKSCSDLLDIFPPRNENTMNVSITCDAC